MVKRYSVCVLDELGRRLDKWKRIISPSAVFQAAIEKVVREREEFIERLEGDPQMPDIIERLREERKDSDQEYRRRGKEKGVEWAKCASYNNIQYVLREKAQIEELLAQNEGIPSFMAFDDGVFGQYITNQWENEFTTPPTVTGRRFGEDFISPDALEWLSG